MSNPIMKSIVEIMKSVSDSPLVLSVPCSVCGYLHDATGDSFLAIHGNVTVGLDNMVIGNNFSDKGELTSMSYCCINDDCFSRFLKPALKERSA